MRLTRRALCIRRTDLAQKETIDMHDDVYQMYLEEIKNIRAFTPEEEQELLARYGSGDRSVHDRILEGMLGEMTELAGAYSGGGLPMGDLIQEANVALILALEEYQGGDFHALVRERVTAALEAALEEQNAASRTGEELLARVNVLKDISARMAEELGREASVEELAEKMKMTPDEIKAIMKLTLDAMSVSPDAEE